MAATLISALVLCVSALFVGQAALRLCGAREWNWMAPMVGLSLLMLIATPALDLPGRATTMAIILGLLSVAAIVWCMASPAHRPPIAGLSAAVPTLGLALVPFLASGHSGIIGVTIDNDMQAHMQFAEMYLSEAVENLKPAYYDLYPLGPHAIAGTLARGLGVDVEHSFAGLTMALPILNGWTVLALLRREAAWWKKWIAAAVVAMPYLVAAYYGQGSFKELTETGLVFATVVFFAGAGPRLGRGRWVPLALLVGGTVSVYSETGIAWPAVIGVIWLFVVTAQRILRRGTAGIVAEVRDALPAIGIGIGALIVVLLPQVDRIHNFIAANSGANGIIVPKDVLANLVGPLPGWEAFGVWHNMDYRLPQSSAFVDKLWIGIVIALVLFGAYRLIRGGRWLLPLAALGSMVIWRVSIHSQSPYVVAKALVIASPLLLACAVLPLLDLIPDRVKLLRDHRLRWGAALVGTVFIALVVGISSVRALRYSPIGPTYHAEQLAELSPLLEDKPTLFLGNDDFVHQELPGVPVKEPLYGGLPEIATRPQKKFAEGAAADFDTVPTRKLNEFDYVITTTRPRGQRAAAADEADQGDAELRALEADRDREPTLDPRRGRRTRRGARLQEPAGPQGARRGRGRRGAPGAGGDRSARLPAAEQHRGGRTRPAAGGMGPERALRQPGRLQGDRPRDRHEARRQPRPRRRALPARHGHGEAGRTGAARIQGLAPVARAAGPLHLDLQSRRHQSRARAGRADRSRVR